MSGGILIVGQSSAANEQQQKGGIIVDANGNTNHAAEKVAVVETKVEAPAESEDVQAMKNAGGVLLGQGALAEEKPKIVVGSTADAERTLAAQTTLKAKGIGK